QRQPGAAGLSAGHAPVVTPEPITREAPPLRGPVISTQDWRDLTFLHWEVDPSLVARFLPAGVRPDVHEGRTYVGLVPFRMVGVSLGRGPGIPWAGTFLETNVRLYSVDRTGRRGVVFLAMAAERAAAVAVGRAVFGLPYRWARMGLRRVGGRRASAARLLRPGPPVRSRVAVSPVGPSIDGDLERFLTARWGLHVAHLGRTWYLPNTHVTWPLRRAEVHELDDGLLAAAGLGDLARRPPDHVAFSEGVAATFGRPVLASTPRPDRTAPAG